MPSVKDVNLPLLAGALSTAIFVASTLPMVVKAARTRDLASYSLGNIALANSGNLVHSLYVFSFPAGPLWVLHSFYVVTSGLMLFWYLRYALAPSRLGGGARRQPRNLAYIQLPMPTGAAAMDISLDAADPRPSLASECCKPNPPEVRQ